MRFSVWLLVLALTPVVACAPAPTPEETMDLEAAKEALLAADKSWAAAYAAADDKPEAFVSATEEGVRLLPPDMPMAVGKAAVEAVIGGMESMPGFRISWAPSAAEVATSGDFGYTVGSADMRLDGPDGAPVAVAVKYLTVWRKQADGSWKVSADMFNADGPPSPLEQESG